MPNTRPFLLLAVLFVGYLLWQQWQTDYSVPPPLPSATAPVVAGDAAKVVPNDVPAAPAPGEMPKPPVDIASTTSPVSTPAQLVNITTDVFSISIDTRGGAVVRADLRAYPIAPKETEHPVRLLSDDATSFSSPSLGYTALTLRLMVMLYTAPRKPNTHLRMAAIRSKSR